MHPQLEDGVTASLYIPHHYCTVQSLEVVDLALIAVPLELLVLISLNVALPQYAYDLFPQIYNSSLQDPRGLGRLCRFQCWLVVHALLTMQCYNYIEYEFDIPWSCLCFNIKLLCFCIQQGWRQNLHLPKSNLIYCLTIRIIQTPNLLLREYSDNLCLAVL